MVKFKSVFFSVIAIAMLLSGFTHKAVASGAPLGVIVSGSSFSKPLVVLVNFDANYSSPIILRGFISARSRLITRLPRAFCSDIKRVEGLDQDLDQGLSPKGDNIWDRSRRVAGLMRSVGTRLASNNRDWGAIAYEMGLLCNYLSEISDPFNSWRVLVADDNIHDAYELDVWTHIQEVPRSSGGKKSR